MSTKCVFSVFLAMKCSAKYSFSISRRSLYCSFENPSQVKSRYHADMNDKTHENLAIVEAINEARNSIPYKPQTISDILKGIPTDAYIYDDLTRFFKKYQQHPLEKSLNIWQVWDVIILLISMAAGSSRGKNFGKIDSDIFKSQQTLAKDAKNVYVAHKMHTLMGSVHGTEKISFTLAACYLISKLCKTLSDMRNQYIAEKVYMAYRNMTESEFIGTNEESDICIPPIPLTDCTGFAAREWKLKNNWNFAYFLGRCCECSLVLDEHDRKLQDQAYIFGVNFGLAWQAYADLTAFIRKREVTADNLYSAPIMFHLEHDPSFSTELDLAVRDQDYTKVFNTVIQGPGIKLTRKLQGQLALKAIRTLSLFERSDAKKQICNIIKVMQDICENGE